MPLNSIDPSNILLIKPSALGDVVHTLPILRLLRRKFPAARITWLIDPAFANLLDGNADLNDTILFDRKRYSSAWRSRESAEALMTLGRELRRRNFDLAIDLQGLLRSALLSIYSGAPVRVGFANAREMAPLFYTHRVPIRSMRVHAIERYLTLAESLGCARGPVEFDFAVTDEHRSQLQHRAENCGVELRPGRAIAILLPGTNWETKKWPVAHFASVAKMLREHHGVASIVAGGPDTPAVVGTESLVGQTNLKQLVALLERAQLVIANDTGPMHIAAALGRPLVSLFGPTNPIRTGPYQRMNSVVRLNIACSPCYSKKCSHQSCMTWLRPEDVGARLASHLASDQGLPLPIR